MTQLPHSIRATVQRVTGEEIELRSEAGQTISWPTSKLAPVIVGEEIELVALTKHDIETERAAVAKHVLNYMLRGDEGSL